MMRPSEGLPVIPWLGERTAPSLSDARARRVVAILPHRHTLADSRTFLGVILLRFATDRLHEFARHGSLHTRAAARAHPRAAR